MELHELLSIAWEAAEASLSSPEFLFPDFTPVTMPITAPTSRIAATRAMKSCFLFFLEMDICLPESDILAKKSLILVILENGVIGEEEEMGLDGVGKGGGGCFYI